MKSAFDASMTELRNRISNVRYFSANTISFRFDNQEYIEELHGRNKDLVLGAGDEHDRAIALRVLLDKGVPFYVDPIHSAASHIGRRGGQVKSEVKSTTARENGRKGGRPAIKQLDLEDI